MHHHAFRRPARAITIGAGAGVVLAAWNLVGMYSSIPIATWDVARQLLFAVALASSVVAATDAARVSRSWRNTALAATLAAVGCAVAVLAVYALSTAWGTESIRQVPEFIRDYTHHGYTSPAEYFADHYWALLQLQVFTWGVGVLGLAVVGTVVVEPPLVSFGGDRHDGPLQLANPDPSVAADVWPRLFRASAVEAQFAIWTCLSLAAYSAMR